MLAILAVDLLEYCIQKIESSLQSYLQQMTDHPYFHFFPHFPPFPFFAFSDLSVNILSTLEMEKKNAI